MCSFKFHSSCKPSKSVFFLHNFKKHLVEFYTLEQFGFNLFNDEQFSFNGRKACTYLTDSPFPDFEMTPITTCLLLQLKGKHHLPPESRISFDNTYFNGIMLEDFFRLTHSFCSNVFVFQRDYSLF